MHFSKELYDSIAKVKVAFTFYELCKCEGFGAFMNNEYQLPLTF